MCNEILMIVVYITIMLRFWIYFDSEFQLINTKPIIENKLKELLNELKKLKVQTILVLHSKKKMIVECSIQMLSLLLVSQTLIKHLNPCIKTLWQKLKNYVCENWMVLDVIIKKSIKMLER